jgi:hypothetical protein
MNKLSILPLIAIGTSFGILSSSHLSFAQQSTTPDIKINGKEKNRN